MENRVKEGLEDLRIFLGELADRGVDYSSAFHPKNMKAHLAFLDSLLAALEKPGEDEKEIELSLKSVYPAFQIDKSALAALSSLETAGDGDEDMKWEWQKIADGIFHAEGCERSELLCNGCIAEKTLSRLQIYFATRAKLTDEERVKIKREALEEIRKIVVQQKEWTIALEVAARLDELDRQLASLKEPKSDLTKRLERRKFKA